jgi:hypothetical protein
MDPPSKRARLAFDFEITLSDKIAQLNSLYGMFDGVDSEKRDDDDECDLRSYWRRKARIARLSASTSDMSDKASDPGQALVSHDHEAVEDVSTNAAAPTEIPIWEYQDDKGTWCGMTVDACEALERAKREGRDEIGWGVYRYDLDGMEQTNTRTMKARCIRIGTRDMTSVSFLEDVRRDRHAEVQRLEAELSVTKAEASAAKEGLENKMNRRRAA